VEVHESVFLITYLIKITNVMQRKKIRFTTATHSGISPKLAAKKKTGDINKPMKYKTVRSIHRVRFINKS